MVPTIYISVVDDRKQLVIDGHLELLSKFLVAIHVADHIKQGCLPEDSAHLADREGDVQHG
jgi:hypothetical protein